jgi:hypothetical protein
VSLYDGTNAPTITVEIDLGRIGFFTIGTSPLGGTDVLGVATSNWTAIPTADVQLISIRRGRSREDQAIQPGILTLNLDNRLSAYDPDNSSTAYMWNGYTLLTVGLGMRVKATYASTDYIIYTGFLDNIEIDASLNPVAVYTCVDALGKLARQLLDLNAPSETTSARVTRILDLIGWPASSRSLTGTRTLVAKVTTAQENALALSEVGATSEFGRFFATIDGNLVLQPYESFFSSTFRGTLSDSRAAGTIEYDTIETNPGSRFLINVASVTDGNGGVVTSVNTDSQARYGTYQRSVSTELNPSAPGTSVSGLADLIANRNALPATRVSSIDFSVAGMDSTVWPQFLQFEFGNNLNVERTSVDGRARVFTSLIESINHDISPNDWRVHLDLSPSQRTATFTLNTSLLNGSDTLWY